MNTVAQTFEALISTARHCPESEYLEVHTVNLVSQLAAMPEGKACVALVCAKNFNRYQGFERVVEILEPYGIQLSRRWHPSEKAFFLFAQLEDDSPDPFAGAQVIVLGPDNSLTTQAVLKVAA